MRHSLVGLDPALQSGLLALALALILPYIEPTVTCLSLGSLLRTIVSVALSLLACMLRHSGDTTGPVLMMRPMRVYVDRSRVIVTKYALMN